MALELVRKIVGGHWRYVVEEEEAGGAAFNGGTITEPLTIESPGEACLVLDGSQEMQGDLSIIGVDPLEQCLTIQPAAGAGDEGTRTFAVKEQSGGSGATVFNVDGAGWTSVALIPDAGFFVGRVAGGTALLRIDEDSKIGFFGKAPAARPEVPASPTAQDVVSALVALGLITQAS